MTYTVKYLEHIHPERNCNKGKHWSNLRYCEIGKQWNNLKKDVYGKAEFETIEKAIEASNECKERYEKNTGMIILKIKVMSGKEVVKEVNL